ncbi:hypothetical protein MFUM_830009 [Methylacidiphilum fumariolicum SolV]|uniref:Uncharacterized protein n=2 Tax=Candidatus Methylacidiphilum fumarolicum TaxID=591154 RepID=I0K084_METFB|nr:conserved protein of unknown function [Candidatus Methylacidiphilum fumarolicum]CCG92903.1 hypothetical protein MFUM_830009 [Methylacidiphilum fumariolicum SolV]
MSGAGGFCIRALIAFWQLPAMSPHGGNTAGLPESVRQPIPLLAAFCYSLFTLQPISAPNFFGEYRFAMSIYN